MPVGSLTATRFNLLGAVIRAAGHRARDAMKAAENALRTCSSEAFARTLASSRPMTHAEAVAWLETAVALIARTGSELPQASPSHSSGLMLKVSAADTAAKQTTGTGGGEDD
jgi:hypothetical protein